MTITAPSGAVVLIAEDDPVVALDLCMSVERAGFGIAGPYAFVSHALATMDEIKPDYALIDVELADDRSIPLAERLAMRGIPFAFVTSRFDLVREAGYADIPCIPRPFTDEDIVPVLTRFISTAPGLLGAETETTGTIET